MQALILFLAQRTGVDAIARGMSSGFRDRRLQVDPAAIVKLVLLLVGAGLIAVLVVRVAGGLWRRWRNTPTWLFWRLCRAHRLSLAQRWLLWRLAAHLRLPDPAEVFVVPRWLEAAGALPGFSGARRRLQSLSQRLYAEAPTAKPRAGSPEALPLRPAAAAGDTEAMLEEIALAEILSARADFESLGRAASDKISR